MTKGRTSTDSGTDSGIVYSTDQGRVCPACKKPFQRCSCQETARQAKKTALKKDSAVRLHLERKGRKGKDVTVITGVPLGEAQLLNLAKELKQKCGAGGAVKDGSIEIQGDHRELLVEELRKRGHAAK